MIANADNACDPTHYQECEQPDKDAERPVYDVQNAQDLHVLCHISPSLWLILSTLLYECDARKFQKVALKTDI